MLLAIKKTYTSPSHLRHSWAMEETEVNAGRPFQGKSIAVASANHFFYGKEEWKVTAMHLSFPLSVKTTHVTLSL